MKNVMLILSIFLTACMAQPKDSGKVTNVVESNVELYVNRFEKISQKLNRPVDLSLIEVVIDQTMQPAQPGRSWTLAICMPPNSQGVRQITLNPHFWNNAEFSNADREEVLFHELGHCVLNRDHFPVDPSTPRNCHDYVSCSIAGNVSIMHPFHLGPEQYTANYDYYMQELFNVIVRPGDHVNAGTEFEEYASTHQASVMVDEKGQADLKGMGCGH